MKKSVLIGITISAVALYVLIMCIVVFSPKEIPSEGLEYSLQADGKSYSVVGVGTCKDELIIIPKKYNGKPVAKIEGSAFYNYKRIVNVKLPNSITSIEGWAFAHCTALESINIPDSVTFIATEAFKDCTSLTSVSIPDSMTSISYAVFYGCTSLISVDIPDSVMRIDGKAFYWCPALRSINFEGTIEQWNAIEKGDNWISGTKSYTIYCTDGTITKDGTITYK